MLTSHNKSKFDVGRFLQSESESESEETSYMPCEVEQEAFEQCVTNGGSVIMEAIDCTFCPVSTAFNLNYFAETNEQRSLVCGGLKSNGYCEEDLYKCVSEQCPDRCHEKVIAYTNCKAKLYDCDLGCSTSAGFKTKAPFALAVGVVAIFGWIQAI